jgi:hypothetical protein
MLSINYALDADSNMHKVGCRTADLDCQWVGAQRWHSLEHVVGLGAAVALRAVHALQDNTKL